LNNEQIDALLSTSNVVKSLGGRGSAPDLAGEAYSAPQTPYMVERGLAVPSPRTPPPLSALRASNLVTFGHSFHAP